MPEHAIAAAAPDYVLPASEISATLSSEIERPLEPVQAGADPVLERDVVEADPTEVSLMDGPPTGLTCPECGGALWEETDAALVRFACHVGHSYSAESLVSEQGQALESSLWTGVRALEERADLLERMSRRSERSSRSASHFRTRAEEAREHARALRALLTRLGRDIAPQPELAGDARQ
jgi:two-component system chemotaxis response regulator CheB